MINTWEIFLWPHAYANRHWALSHLASKWWWSRWASWQKSEKSGEKTTQNNKPHILLFVLLRLFSLRDVCVQQCVFYLFLHLLCAAVFDSGSQFFCICVYGMSKRACEIHTWFCVLRSLSNVLSSVLANVIVGIGEAPRVIREPIVLIFSRWPICRSLVSFCAECMCKCDRQCEFKCGAIKQTKPPNQFLNLIFTLAHGVYDSRIGFLETFTQKIDLNNIF